ncbi:PREDICTED: uncharacterized protein LOC104811970 [Tarenaya hassleriana]|uniref:uncharacterized protein LOC104811970 n=1 Tax=Tarenaya hassleriana TaxID=28532 RepID=UPI00053C76F2|nr:PREDICTED: uncharacterized protein LOC104811970 [Tarenaya hassleriana]
MRNVNNTVETVNAAATAIVTAESRVQPTAVQKRRWGSCWSLYSCFGSQKNNKRIGHAVLVPDLAVPGVPVATIRNSTTSTPIVLPFIAPPSSPAGFLQSDPPSVAQSPAGLLSLTINTYSPSGPSSAFAIGPYAHETQPVTPPQFSAFTTEPSTAPFTPPPESVHMTTPSSPEVPFAQLLASSLERARRNSDGMDQKFSSSHYEFQSHQVYQRSPGGNLISPGSVISNSGTSSPYPVKCPIVEFRAGEPPKLLGFEHFTARKWGSRFGSGSITPVGQGSRLGSGALTPDGGGLGSRLGSGSVTPITVGISRLSSGAMTPDGIWPAPLEGTLLENQISEVASLANSDHGSRQDEVAVDHRVSFELTGEDVARCLASKLNRSGLDVTQDRAKNGNKMETEETSVDRRNSCHGETSGNISEKGYGETESEQSHKLRSFSLGSSKEFNFDNRKEEIPEKPAVRREWWANEKVAGKGDSPGNNWSFFPGLRSAVS